MSQDHREVEQHITVVLDGKAVAAFDADPVKSRVGNAEANVQEAAARVKVVHGFYTNNELVIKGAFDAFGSLVAGELNTKTTDAVLDVTKKIMGALDCVKQVHPFIQVAVLAFKVVIDFEIRRRENDKRVSALIVQGTDMMIELFELNELAPDPKTAKPDGHSIEGRLQTVLDRVARAVDDCGNSLNKYRNTGGLVKFFKSGDWEDKFTGHAKRFDGLKQDLRDAIAIHSARTVENVSRKLDAIYDMITSKTKQEVELAVAVDSRGGIAACVSNSATIRELMQLQKRDDGSKGAGTVAQVLHDVRAPLAEILDENRMAYTVLLEARKNEITDAIRGSEERLRDALEVRAYMRVKDPHLRHLWQSARWSMNVGTSEFIAAVFDYFSEQYARSKAIRHSNDLTVTDEAGALTLTHTSMPPSPVMSVISLAPDNEHASAPPVALLSPDDEWCIEYLDVFYIQALKESFDEDANGMVNVREVNVFTASTVLPSGWSILRRLVYAAAGWHLEAMLYRNQIEALINSMVYMQSEVLPANRSLVWAYLETRSIRLVQAFIRGIADSTRDVPDASILLALAREKMNHHEGLLQALLERTHFEIPSNESAAVYFGKGRFEHYFLPTIFVLMRRHAEIIQLAKAEILDSRELAMGNNSLEFIIFRALNRMDHLEESWRLQSLDPDTKYATFARGLYSILWDDSKSPDDADYWEDHRDVCEDVGVVISHIEPNVLRYGIPVPVLPACPPNVDSQLREQNMKEYAELAKVAAPDVLAPLGSHSPSHLSLDQSARRAELMGLLSSGDTQYLDAVADLELRHSGVLSQFYCDGCEISPIRGALHRCLDCENENYDLCLDCVHIPPDTYKTGPAHEHSLHHNMIRYTGDITANRRRRLARGAFSVLPLYAADTTSPQCRECASEITDLAKLYVCISCQDPCYICLKCSDLTTFTNTPEHTRDSHWLVLFRDRSSDSANGKKIPAPRPQPDPYAPKPRPPNVEDLAKRLAGLDDRVAALDASVAKILDMLQLITTQGLQLPNLPASSAQPESEKS